MAGATLGFLRYILGLDTVQFRKGMTQAERDLVVMQKRFANVGEGMVGLGAKMSIAVTAPLAALAAKGIKEAQETADAMGQVNAALASMGPVAGRTAQQLEQAANAFEGASLFEADQVLRDVTANLLTFGNISGKVFDQAQQAAIDYATRAKIGLKEATLQIAKALNDPVNGLGSLTKNGTLSREWIAGNKAMIASLVATGQTAKAQGLILAEIQRQNRNSAIQAQEADPWNQLNDAMNGVAEQIGKAVIPLLKPLANALTTVAGAFTSLSPGVQQFILVTGGIAAISGPVIAGLGGIIGVVAKIGPAVAALSKGWAALKVGMVAARAAALATLPSLVPLLAPLAAIAVAVGAVYLAWKNWDTIVAVVKRLYQGVKTWLQDKLSAVFNWVGDKLKWVADKFKWLDDVVVRHSYIPDMVDSIGDEMARLQAVMVDPVQKATETAADAFRTLQQSAASILASLYPEAARRNQLVGDINLLTEAAEKGAISADTLAAAIARLREEYLAAGGSVSSLPIEAVGVATVVSPASIDDVNRAVDQYLGRMPEVQQQTSAWGDVLSQVGQDLSAMLGDFLAQAVEGGAKLKDLFKSLLSYAVRFLTSQNGGLSSLIGGARANGGPVSSGKVYLVGERGPELFAPGASGSIIPNHQLASAGGRAIGGGTTVHMTINTPNADSFRRSDTQIARAMKRRMAAVR